MTLEEQLTWFDRKAEQLYVCSFRRLKNQEYRELVLERARQRLIEGEAMYGDLMFHWPYARLRDEELQEHADGMINYPLARFVQGWPT